ncbi:hypothetical protein MHYP_G00258450 [Metynnis hypsauchen]
MFEQPRWLQRSDHRLLQRRIKTPGHVGAHRNTKRSGKWTLNRICAEKAGQQIEVSREQAVLARKWFLLNFTLGTCTLQPKIHSIKTGVKWWNIHADRPQIPQDYTIMLLPLEIHQRSICVNLKPPYVFPMLSVKNLGFCGNITTWSKANQPLFLGLTSN